MAELTPNIAPHVVAACEAGASEAAEALTRALDATIQVSPGEATVLRADRLPDEFDGPGLAVVLTFGEVGAVALLPEATGLVPEWYAAPDATGASKLTTLAQELSMVLVPEEFMADTFHAAKVESLSEALGRAQLASESGMVPLALSSGEKQGTLSFIWPVAAPDAMFAEEPEEEPASEASEETPEPSPQPSPAATSHSPQQTRPKAPLTEDQLPHYSRSLLRIELPLTVNLASKKQSIQEILELGAGSIIKFEKSCDELLDVEVGECQIARGEAVKVGDKFGVRINSIILPEERFHALKPANKQS